MGFLSPREKLLAAKSIIVLCRLDYRANPKNSAAAALLSLMLGAALFSFQRALARFA